MNPIRQDEFAAYYLINGVVVAKANKGDLSVEGMNTINRVVVELAMEHSCQRLLADLRDVRSFPMQIRQLMAGAREVMSQFTGGAVLLIAENIGLELFGNTIASLVRTPFHIVHTKDEAERILETKLEEYA